MVSVLGHDHEWRGLKRRTSRLRLRLLRALCMRVARVKRPRLPASQSTRESFRNTQPVGAVNFAEHACIPASAATASKAHQPQKGAEGTLLREPT